MTAQVSRRRFLKFGALGVGGILAGCAPKVVEVTRQVEKIVEQTVEVEKKVEVTKQVEKQVTVVVEKQVAATRTEIVVTGRLGSEDTLWEEIKGGFYEANPDILVKVQAFPGAFTDYLSKIQSLAAGGTLGDVIYTTITTSLFDICVNAGLFAPLDSAISAAGFDPAQVYYQASLDVTNRQGEQYALPHYCHPSYWFIFYNPILFEKHNVEPPNWEKDTLETLLEKAKLLTKDTDGDGKIDQWGLMQPNMKDVAIQGVTRLFGGQTLDNSMATKSLHNSPEAKAGISWLYDLIYTHKVSPSQAEAPQGADPLFRTGKIAMAMGGVWLCTSWGDAVIKDFQTQVDLCPAGPTGGWWGTVHTDAWSLVKAGKHPEEAWRLLYYLSGPEAAVLKGRSAGGTGLAGCAPAAWTDQTLMDRRPRLCGGKIMELFHKAMEKAQGYYLAGNFRNNELFTAQDQKLDLLWTGNETPTDAFFDELQAACQAVLDKPKP